MLDGPGVTPHHLALTPRSEPAHPLYLAHGLAPSPMTLPFGRGRCVGPAARREVASRDDPRQLVIVGIEDDAQPPARAPVDAGDTAI